MRYMVCPQCGISNFYVLNERGERLNVKVSRELVIICNDKSESLEGFNLNVLYCLGCSWSGPINQLNKYFI
ncbi:MAG: hypothetical protein C0597_07045 [Marinilabiliales bacterium]|nr:MAG: hypothetical protein C0597_07045 [Marinilabiliales bacterium]